MDRRTTVFDDTVDDDILTGVWVGDRERDALEPHFSEPPTDKSSSHRQPPRSVFHDTDSRPYRDSSHRDERSNDSEVTQTDTAQKRRPVQSQSLQHQLTKLKEAAGAADAQIDSVNEQHGIGNRVRCQIPKDSEERIQFRNMVHTRTTNRIEATPRLFGGVGLQRIHAISHNHDGDVRGRKGRGARKKIERTLDALHRGYNEALRVPGRQSQYRRGKVTLPLLHAVQQIRAGEQMLECLNVITANLIGDGNQYSSFCDHLIRASLPDRRDEAIQALSRNISRNVSTDESRQTIATALVNLTLLASENWALDVLMNFSGSGVRAGHPIAAPIPPIINRDQQESHPDDAISDENDGGDSGDGGGGGDDGDDSGQRTRRQSADQFDSGAGESALTEDLGRDIRFQQTHTDTLGDLSDVFASIGPSLSSTPLRIDDLPGNGDVSASSSSFRLGSGFGSPALPEHLDAGSTEDALTRALQRDAQASQNAHSEVHRSEESRDSHKENGGESSGDLFSEANMDSFHDQLPLDHSGTMF